MALKRPLVEFLKSYITDIYEGYKIYKTIIRIYGIDTDILVCSPRGTGDIYIIGMYFDSFLKKNDISKYTFIFRGNSEKK